MPAAIKGTDKLSRLKLKVAYGEPFDPGDDARAATDKLMSDIEKLYETL